MEIPRRPEDTLNPADRAAHARAPSAATGKADRRKALRRAEPPAWAAEHAAVELVAAEADLTAAEADVTNRRVACSW